MYTLMNDTNILEPNESPEQYRKNWARLIQKIGACPDYIGEVDPLKRRKRSEKMKKQPWSRLVNSASFAPRALPFRPTRYTHNPAYLRREGRFSLDTPGQIRLYSFTEKRLLIMLIMMSRLYFLTEKQLLIMSWN